MRNTLPGNKPKWLVMSLAAYLYRADQDLLGKEMEDLGTTPIHIRDMLSEQIRGANWPLNDGWTTRLGLRGACNKCRHRQRATISAQPGPQTSGSAKHEADICILRSFRCRRALVATDGRGLILEPLLRPCQQWWRISVAGGVSWVRRPTPRSPPRGVMV